jgi:hypothetical protein
MVEADQDDNECVETTTHMTRYSWKLKPSQLFTTPKCFSKDNHKPDVFTADEMTIPE